MSHQLMFYKRRHPYFNSAAAERARSRRLFRSVVRDHVDIAEVKEIGQKPGARWAFSGYLGTRSYTKGGEAGA